MKFVNYITIAVLSLALLAGTAHAQTRTQGSVRLPAGAGASPPSEPAPEPAPEVKPVAPAQAKAEEKPDERVYLNVQDQDIKDVIKQISKATGKNFIIDAKVRGKVTIISEKMMSQEEAYQAFLSALEVAGFTVVTGPGGIIKIVALKEALSSPIPIHVDSTPYTDSFVTRLISLNNINANDMANAIKGLVSKSGNLFAYPATNTLIITDSGTNIDRLMKLIKELDQEGPQEVVEIIPVFYADAKDVAAKVLQLFEIEKATAARASTTRRTRGAAASAPLEDIKAVSKIIADERTNSIIVLASKRSIDRVRSLIKKLDSPLDDSASGSVHVHYLKHANAVDMAATLSSLTSGAGAASKTTAAKGKMATQATATKTASVARLEGGVSITADESTNALIITASARDYETLVKDLISKLDIPRRQVFLESIVMELTMRKTGDYGVQAFGGGGSSSVLGFGQTFGALNSLMQPEFFATGGLLGGAFGRDTVTINIPSTSGAAQTATVPSFAAFLNLIQTYADTNVVSTPNILTLDNEEAEITVTRKEYASSTTTTATGLATSTPVPLEAGLTLKITPQISEGDMVKLKIQHELSNFEEKPADAPASPQRARKINTTVMAADGQTVVLGGLMEDQVSTTKSKVPILGDIPILGWLFRQQRTVKTKSNLLVFITPHVIRDPSDFSEVLKRKIDQRNRFVNENYGKKQREAIRDVIRAHRADLLEYVPPPPPAPPAATAEPLGTPLATTKTSAPPPTAMPVSTGKQPVITVPSPDSYRGTTRAYPSSGAIESSSTKPVGGSSKVTY